LQEKKIQDIFFQIAINRKYSEPKKYSESCWKATFYITAFSWGMYNVWQTNIFPKTGNCWIGYPYQHHNTSVVLYYIYQLGFYFHSLYCHFTMEVKRSDYWPLFFHHVVTIWLIYFSLIVDFHRIGILVLVCHDIADIPLEIGKTAVYRGAKNEQIFWYLALVVIWLCSRLGVYPSYIIYSTYIEAIIILGRIPFYSSFNAALFFLQLLHIYWFVLIIRTGYRVATGKTVVDAREDKDD